MKYKHELGRNVPGHTSLSPGEVLLTLNRIKQKASKMLEHKSCFQKMGWHLHHNLGLSNSCNSGSLQSFWEPLYKDFCQASHVRQLETEGVGRERKCTAWLQHQIPKACKEGNKQSSVDTECKQPRLRVSTMLWWWESNFPSISTGGGVRPSGGFLAAENWTVGIKPENAAGLRNNIVPTWKAIIQCH